MERLQDHAVHLYFGFVSRISGRRSLPFGQAVYLIVVHNHGNIHVSPYIVDKVIPPFPVAIAVPCYRDYMHFVDLDRTYLVWRSGYTGEDGFELMIPNEDAIAVWESLFKHGEDLGVKPIGLGARDTLRLEKALLLSGQDFDFNHTSLETNVSWVVKWDHEFVGKNILVKQKEEGIPQKFVAFHLKGRGIPRTGMEILKDGKTVGIVTSGTMVPGKKIGMGLGYVNLGLHEFGSEFEVQVRNNLVPAEVVNPRA